MMKLVIRYVKNVSYCRRQTVKIPPIIFYDTVRKTQDYHQFVPWCRQSQIVKKISQCQNQTVLRVNFNKLLDIRYKSHVKIDVSQKQYKIESICRDSPLKYLQSIWTIGRQNSNSCEINYNISFQFDNYLYQTFTTTVFLNFMGESMWNIFLKRANQKHQSTKLQIDKLDNTQIKPIIDQKSVHASKFQQFLQKRQYFQLLSNKNIVLRKQMEIIYNRLYGTKDFEQKIEFEINNMLSHLNDVQK